MAARLQNTYVIDLGGIVETAIRSVKTIKARELAIKEAAFQSAVAEGNMSYEAQMKYREQQLIEERESSIPDTEFISNLEASIASTKKLARYEKVRTKYSSALDQYAQGKQSIAGLIGVVQGLMDRTEDPTLLQELRTEMSGLIKTRADNETAAVTNRANVAERDLSIPLMDKSIAEIQDRRAQDSLNGNEEAVTAWDATLFSLNTKKSALIIQNATNEITYRTSRNDLKTHQKVELIDQVAASADASKPFIYDGVQYMSQQDYWNKQRDSVINSPEFWASLAADIDAETTKIASTSPSGQVPVSRIKEIDNFYNSLKTRAGFENYGNRIDQERTSMVDTAVNELASFIESEASVTEDYETARNAATELERTFGIKLTRVPETTEKSFAATTTEAAKTTAAQPAARVFTAKENAELKAAEARITAGINSPQDKTNVEFAKSKGWSTSTKDPAPTVTPAATPTVTPASTPAVTPAPVVTETPVTTVATPPVETKPVTTKPYAGSSISDFLKSKGQDSSFAARAVLAKNNGIDAYTGTADQNIALLNKLNV